MSTELYPTLNGMIHLKTKCRYNFIRYFSLEVEGLKFNAYWGGLVKKYDNECQWSISIQDKGTVFFVTCLHFCQLIWLYVCFTVVDIFIENCQNTKRTLLQLYISTKCTITFVIILHMFWLCVVQKYFWLQKQLLWLVFKWLFLFIPNELWGLSIDWEL